MLAAEYRLTGEEEFARVQKEGRVFQSKSFGLAVYDRKDEEYPHFGFVVSNKISKESTQRNRIKRALREAVRQSIVYLKKGQDVVFLVKKASLKESTETLMGEVRRSLKQTGLLL